MNIDEFKKGMGELTVRELEIVLMVIKGMASKVIASKLYISPRTVELHRANAMQKLRTTNVAQITRLYVISEAIRIIDNAAVRSVIRCDAAITIDEKLKSIGE